MINERPCESDSTLQSASAASAGTSCKMRQVRLLLMLPERTGKPSVCLLMLLPPLRVSALLLMLLLLLWAFACGQARTRMLVLQSAAAACHAFVSMASHIDSRADSCMYVHKHMSVLLPVWWLSPVLHAVDRLLHGCLIWRLYTHAYSSQPCHGMLLVLQENVLFSSVYI